MYHLLIVDDEKKEREGIKFILRKHNIPLKISEADDGVAALDHMQRHPVHILMTDIRMKDMDGLAMAKAVRAFNPDVKIVVSSAYSEFSYAKQAIDLNVERYMVKPFDIEEFIDLIVRLTDQLRQRETERQDRQRMRENYDSFRQEKALLDIVKGGLSDDDIKALLKLSRFSWQEKLFQLLVISTTVKFAHLSLQRFVRELEELLPSPFECLRAEADQVLVLLQFHAPPADEQLRSAEVHVRQLFERHCGLPVFVAVGETANTVYDLPKTYARLLKVLDSCFFAGESQVVVSPSAGAERREEPSSAEVERQLNRLRHIVREQDTQDLNRGLSALFDMFERSGSFSSMYAKYICIEIMKEICHCNKIHAHKFEKMVDAVYEMKSFKEVKETIFSLLSSGDWSELSRYADSSRKVIHETMDIIHSEYMKDIGLDAIAQRVFLSSSYLSHLFKKVTGESMVSYITNCRLQKAGEFLRQTNMKVAEVSESVGIPNVPYFCVLFKNRYGLTPAKYRERSE